ncbi:FecR family protein [Aliikangiella coralliicola]|uniref:FecR family protein n=1 Tax=Aliikangiella coralliicola TaxID=2592383 RepID=A0A545U8V0_9GAMM|nr:FecR family protein [Aliikangiella coralliicola]TQV85900.1 FecR family protein [Aliikangiella coralliicola]
MSQFKTSQITQVREQAADWLLRMESSNLDELEEQQFVSWLNHDELHQDIFAQVEQVWLDTGQLPDNSVQTAQVVKLEQPTQHGDKNERRSVGWKPWAIAASLLLGMLVIFPEFQLRYSADYMTSVGEQREVILEDNSRVLLNTDSAIQVHYSDNLRRVVLLQGEAFFDVMDEPDRAFIVNAGELSARALGTAFSVRLFQDDSARVTVTEHRVQVKTSNDTSGEKHLVDEGQAFYQENGESKLQSVDPLQATAWHKGRLIIDNQPLAEVIEEINRYHSGKIVLRGDGVNDLIVSGVFRLDQPLATLEKLKVSLKLDITQITPYFVIVSKA